MEFYWNAEVGAMWSRKGGEKLVNKIISDSVKEENQAV